MTRSDITVRCAVPEDCPVFAEIEAVSAEQPWNEAQLTEELSHDFAVLLTALRGEEVIGMLDMHLTGEAYINEISVRPDSRRLGAGEALLRAAVRICVEREQSRIILDVRSRNSAARSLYEKAGFRELCTRRNIYADPEDDGVTYEMDLADPER